MIWIIAIGCLLVGFAFGVLMTFGSSRERYSNWTSISLHVKEVGTEERYIADRYKLCTDDNTPYLRIYEGNKFKWYPIWHFKEPYMIMMIIDKDYAVKNMLKLCGIDSGKNSTEADKK